MDKFDSGQVFVFPTDTVWGIGCWLNDLQSIKRVYQIKNRPLGKPTGIFVSDIAMATEYGEFSHKALALANAYWPGGLSIVVPAKKPVPIEIRSAEGSVSIRVPRQPQLLESISQKGSALLQTSANFSGEMTPTLRKELDPTFLEKVDFVMDGESSGGMASTIVDATTDTILVLRQGPVTIQ